MLLLKLRASTSSPPCLLNRILHMYVCPWNLSLGRVREPFRCLIRRIGACGWGILGNSLVFRTLLRYTIWYFFMVVVFSAMVAL